MAKSQPSSQPSYLLGTVKVLVLIFSLRYTLKTWLLAAAEIDATAPSAGIKDGAQQQQQQQAQHNLSQGRVILHISDLGLPLATCLCIASSQGVQAATVADLFLPLRS